MKLSSNQITLSVYSKDFGAKSGEHNGIQAIRIQVNILNHPILIENRPYHVEKI
jgi:hypothetical protein